MKTVTYPKTGDRTVHRAISQKLGMAALWAREGRRLGRDYYQDIAAQYENEAEELAELHNIELGEGT